MWLRCAPRALLPTLRPGSQSLHCASNIHWADSSGFKRVSIFAAASARRKAMFTNSSLRSPVPLGLAPAPRCHRADLTEGLLIPPPNLFHSHWAGAVSVGVWGCWGHQGVALQMRSTRPHNGAFWIILYCFRAGFIVDINEQSSLSCNLLVQVRIFVKSWDAT